MQLFVRWLLVLVLAFDLAGTPFHAHAGDPGPDHAGASAAALAMHGVDGCKGLEHLPDGHMLMAVRAVGHLDGQVADAADLLPGPAPVLLERLPAADQALPAHPRPAPRPVPRRSWPDGRAPPAVLA